MQAGSVPAKDYFFRLDALRFMAFAIVFLNHITFFLHWPPTESVPGTPAYVYFETGDLGVGFFFVLSGFLITYLLEKEYAKTGTISFKNFYTRRILRIWPLYFLALGTIIVISLTFKGFTLYKTGLDWHEILYHVFFFGNVFRAFQNTSNDMIAILWSIAVEEQFYVLWPLIYRFTRKYIGWVIALGIIVSMGFRYYYANNLEVREFYTPCVMIYLFVGTAIGIYGTYFREWIQGKALRIGLAAAAGVIGVLSVRGFMFPYHYPQWFIALDGLLFASCFGIMILCAAFGNSSRRSQGLRAQNPIEAVLEYLGTVSYGLYVYHLIALTIVVYIAQKIGFQYTNLASGHFFVLACSTLALTVAIASTSYYLWEKPFLKLKEKFVKA